MSEDSLINIRMNAKNRWFLVRSRVDSPVYDCSVAVSFEWLFKVPYKSLLLRGGDLMASLLEMRWSEVEGTTLLGPPPVISFEGLGLEVHRGKGNLEHLSFSGHVHPSLAYFTRMWGVLTKQEARIRCQAHPPMNHIWALDKTKAVTELGTSLWDWYQRQLPLREIPMEVSLSMGTPRDIAKGINLGVQLTLPLRSL